MLAWSACCSGTGIPTPMSFGDRPEPCTNLGLWYVKVFRSFGLCEVLSANKLLDSGIDPHSCEMFYPQAAAGQERTIIAYKFRILTSATDPVTNIGLKRGSNFAQWR